MWYVLIKLLKSWYDFHSSVQIISIFILKYLILFNLSIKIMILYIKFVYLKLVNKERNERRFQSNSVNKIIQASVKISKICPCQGTLMLILSGTANPWNYGLFFLLRNPNIPSSPCPWWWRRLTWERSRLCSALHRPAWSSNLGQK